MVPLVVDDVAPFDDWTAAARGTLAFLYSTVGLDVWMLTRLEGDEQVVLYAHPREVVPVGAAVPWDRRVPAGTTLYYVAGRRIGSRELAGAR